MNVFYEFVFFVINSLLLLLEGVSDYKFRGVPIQLVTTHTIIAIASTIYRLLTMDLQTFLKIYIGLAVVATIFVILYMFTGLIGEGDVVIAIITTAQSPCIAVGYFKYLSIQAILAIVIASSYLLFHYMRTTPVVYIEGLGRVRAKARYAADLKYSNLKETPIYVEGLGEIPKDVVKSLSKLRKFLENASDNAIVYTIPNYPFIFYYSIFFIFTYILLSVLSILLSLVM
ncbi:hypothetical protein QPL79_04865 [Ignisphaera sp. 4213-co]|uniref:A24 family peptidase n=1 Tax=Ignisphaera cupida TaxID=3050454 RepID=A0ABD4Z5V7_9CREN|nr:hypothetical protein [Ignisphaera sp. 4213-co]MDK6028686.1 hypothetical protein [Ignisphaera sp. 4213-co]